MAIIFESEGLGMGPGEPGQLCPEEMTAWDSFSQP